MFERRKIMRKIDVVNLIKNHIENDEESFKMLSYKIANEFSEEGDKELSRLIYSFLSDANSFVPQGDMRKNGFLDFVNVTNLDDLYLPETVMKDVVGVYNAISRKINLNKFLFYGAPGTGKTEAVKLLARKLKRELWVVSIRDLIDSRLGETAKNIHSLFCDINNYQRKNKIVVLFDEIDSIAMNRNDDHDLREMGRATTEFLNGLDCIDPNVVLIGTTNLYENFDKAILRRFNKSIYFSRYKKQDLIDIGMKFYNQICDKIDSVDIDNHLFKKILSSADILPFPGELKNLIYTSIAFSSEKKPCEYYGRFICSIHDNAALSIEYLQLLGFTYREIGKILNKSKSDVGRKINNGKK